MVGKFSAPSFFPGRSVSGRCGFAQKAVAVAVASLLWATPTWALYIKTSLSGFDVAEAAIVDAAIDGWEQLIVDPFTLTLDIGKLALPTSVGALTRDFRENDLGIPSSATILINDGSGGFPWFVDPTPYDHEEFNLGEGPFQLLADPDGPANEMFDLLSVLNHELAHALGFSTQYSRFSENVVPGPGLFRTYAGDAVTATLTPASWGTHLDYHAFPYDLMNPFLTLGERLLPTDFDVAILADAYGYQVIPPQPPALAEPSTLTLFACGLGCLAWLHLKTKT